MKLFHSLKAQAPVPGGGFARLKSLLWAKLFRGGCQQLENYHRVWILVLILVLALAACLPTPNSGPHFHALTFSGDRDPRECYAYRRSL